MKRRKRRLLSGCLAVLLMVSMNVNPLAVIAQGIVDSGIVDRFVNLKNNLVYVAQGGADRVSAADVVSLEDPLPVIPGGISAYSLDSTSQCDATEAINKLMGTGKVTMTDLKKTIDADVVLITGTIEEGTESISYQLGDVNDSLRNISGQLAGINATIERMQHRYQVAHIYSLNNESNNALWRPYSDDVPYVKDFAIVSGPFAAVYTGYWDTAVTTVNNPMGSKAERALNILGYDAVVRWEGVVLQKSVGAVGSNGMSGESTTYEDLGTPGSSAWTIATIEREEIGVDAITWLDAVTVLYKALDQEQYTYQSFKSRNYSITPETSPVYNGLSNPVPTVEADGSQHYDGWDFKMFITRSNVISGTSSQSSKAPVYWTKAVQDGFIPASADMEDPIMASDFLKLAHRMMVAYGEPEMTMDETMAMLQVYGTNFPISLGIDIADAWAYLKVRGCLSDDVIQHIGSTVSRDDLLDICMRIKDKDSRLDYKNIEVVLDIGELLRDDGYYPVYDLEFSVGEFSTSIEYDYTMMDVYGYCITMTNSMLLGNTGKMLICSEPNIDKQIPNAREVSSSIDIEGYKSILFTVPKNYTGNIYVTKVDLSKKSIVSGSVDWICIPASLLGGGYFFNSFTIEGKVAVAQNESYHELDYLSADKRLHPYADFVRAGEERPKATVKAANATFSEGLMFAWDKWTSPMTVEAKVLFPDITAIDDVTVGAVKATYSRVLDNTSTSTKKASFRFINTLEHVDGDMIFDSWPTSSSYVIDDLVLGNYKEGRNGLYIANDPRDLYLCRMYLATKYPLFMESVKANECPWRPTGNSTDPERSGSVSQTMNAIFQDYTVINHSWLPNSTPSEKVISDAVYDNTARHLDQYGALYQGYYGDFALRYLLGTAPASTMIEYGDKGTQACINTKFNQTTRYHGESTTGSDVGMLNKQLAREAIRDFKENLDSNDVSKAVDVKVTNAIRAAKLSTATYDEDTGEFTYTFGSKTGAQSFIDTVATFSQESEFVNIQKPVSTSAVMSRDEEKLLSWTALVDAGVVVPERTGGWPTQQSDGSYMFYTKDGMVKVNPRLYTIQIGTTLYDLAPEDGGKGPLLVYIDQTHQESKEMYIDVRCVMGVVAQDFVRNENKTTQIRNAIGSQGYVVYDIGAKGLSSPIFTSYDIGCYNFPDVPSTVIGGIKDSGLPSNNYTAKVFGTTVYDNKYSIGGGRNYWEETNYNRLCMSSFIPTANWITVIDQTEDEDARASLFVYYPIAPFKNGFVNEAGSEVDKVDPKGKDFSGAAANARSRTALANALDSCYPEDIRDEWYVQMTYAAAASLYDMTGLWYLRGDFVIREFKITNNVADNVEAWAQYVDVDNNYVTTEPDKLGVVRYKDAGNADGAVYWLEGIGFVYNMPTADEFNLKDYLEGRYPLPIATVSRKASSVSQVGMINYNMNYWGCWVDKDGENREAVPYGYTLSPNGYIHYKTNEGIKYLTTIEEDGRKVEVNLDILPTRDDSTSSGLELLPYRSVTSDMAVGDDYMHLAPAGVYFYFGGNTMENVPPNSTTKTMTSLNQFYYGTSRVVLNSLDNSNLTAFDMVSTAFNPIRLSNGTPFYRVYRNMSMDVLINNGVVEYGSTSGIKDVVVDDYITDFVSSPLDGMVSGSLLRAIDEGSSLAIIIAFNVLPMIGIILMTILVGLSFVNNIRMVQLVCEKTIDPVKLLTFGTRDIYHWNYKTVLFPCILLYCVFALFLNGNIIRLLSWAAKWYGVTLRYVKNVF